MTNPNNAIGTPAAYGGRSSIKGFNALTQIFTSGVVSGFTASAGTGLNINVGGTANVADIAIAENNEGLRTTIINRGSSAVSLSLGTAPSTNKVMRAVVAYVKSSTPSTSAEIDNQSACGIIVVSGTESNNPMLPSDSTIRDAITADGGTGASAYYVIVASAVLTAGSASITAINQGTPSTCLLSAPAPVQEQQIFLPDYATTPTQVTGSSYEVPRNGFLRVTKGSGSNATANINGRLAVSDADVGMTWLAVAAGDTYAPSTTDTTKISSYFFEGRWVS